MNDLDIVIDDIVRDVDTCDICFNVYKGKSLVSDEMLVYIVHLDLDNSLEIRECIGGENRC